MPCTTHYPQAFLDAVERTLQHEGGYSNNPVDRGGRTNWGISTEFLRRIGDQRDVADLSREDAIELYYEHYWRSKHYNELPKRIAQAVFDFDLNTRPGRAGKALQRACRALGHELVEDGVIGPKTRSTARRIAEVHGELPLLAAYRSERAAIYRLIAQADKALGDEFLKGWLRRAYS